MDKNIIKSIIDEIEDKLDELEMLIDPEFMKEVKKRAKDVENGIDGLDEKEIFDLLKG